MPGAINLPVLSDEERAQVGTIYVQESPFLARKLGAALVARNAAAHIEGPLAGHDGGWRPLVYCWRGGQRSGAFATILSQIGWRVEVLEGGYQSYRRLVVKRLYDDPVPSRVVLLDGNTGTAKTDILGALGNLGVQVIDLEGLANHRGSALGGRGVQPSQKAFESALAAQIDALDLGRPVVIEAESSRVGRLNLPPRLFAAMKDAPRIEISAPVEARAEYLTRAYADLVEDRAALEARLDRLVRLQGRETVEAWKGLAAGGRHLELAGELIRAHYDPRYRKVRERVGGAEITTLETNRLAPEDVRRLAGEIAERLAALEAAFDRLQEFESAQIFPLPLGASFLAVRHGNLLAVRWHRGQEAARRLRIEEQRGQWRVGQGGIDGGAVLGPNRGAYALGGKVFGTGVQRNVRETEICCELRGLGDARQVTGKAEAGDIGHDARVWAERPGNSAAG